MIGRTASLLACMLAFGVVPAAAADRPVDDGLVLAAFQDAAEWWAGLGSPPPDVQLYFRPAAEMANGPDVHAETLPGRVWVNEDFVRDEIRAKVASRRYLREGKMWVLTQLWSTAAHELGHQLGYDHEARGIMALTGLPPGRAVEWAYGLLPKRKMHHAPRARRHAS